MSSTRNHILVLGILWVSGLVCCEAGHVAGGVGANGSVNASTQEYGIAGGGGGVPPNIQVRLYAVIVAGAIMMPFAILGLLSNMALLLSTRCKKSVRSLQYWLPYCLAFIQLIFCLLWVPLDLTRLVLNTGHREVLPVTCYMELVIFHFCMAAVVFLCLFIVLQRVHSVCGSNSEQAQNVLVMLGIIISVIMGLISAAWVIMDPYPASVDYHLCTQTWGTLPNQVLLPFAHRALPSIWEAFLFLTFLVLLIIVLIQKNRLRQTVPHKSKKQSSKKRKEKKVEIVSGAVEISGDDRKEESKMAFLLPGNVKCGEGGSTSRNPSIAESILSGQIRFQLGRQTDNDSDISDDDEFDQRMKLKLQKSSSGRRHTVANIGTGFGHGGNRSPRSPVNYHYVRKWSVDITALQDQLENPKTYNKPFASLTRLKEKETTPPPEHIEESQEDSGDNIDEDKSEEPERDRLIAFSDSVPSSPLAPPELIVNGSEGHPEVSEMKELNVDQKEEEDGDEEEVLRRRNELQQDIQTHSLCILLVVVVLVCTFPFCLVQHLAPYMSPELNRNLSLISAALCVLQTPLHPLLLAWMEKRLWQALHRLKVKLTHWRCVCYCNIGKGRQCVGRSAYEERASVAV